MKRYAIWFIRSLRSLPLLAILCGVDLTAYADQVDTRAASSNPSLEDSTDASYFASAIPSEKPIHLLVGRSMSVSAKHRLTRVYVTNPAVIYAFIASPKEVLLTSKQTGVSSLVVWDENGESQSFLVSSDIDVGSLRDSFKQAMPNEQIHVQAEEERITLSGTISNAAMSEAAVRLAGLYSKNVSNALLINSSLVRQVRLKVRILEVDRSKLNQFGINLFSAGGNKLIQSSTTQFPSNLTASTGGSSSSASGGSTSTVGGKSISISNPLNFLLYSSQLNIGAMVQDLESRQVLQILAEPNITTLSGQKASFLAGGEFPFPVVQGSTGGLTSISIQFRPYGVKLDFTPRVNSDGTIELWVAPEVSALDYTNAVQISGYTIPALSTRRAETQVVLRSGQSFAISGLLDRRTTDQLGKTPGAASIPVLGQLFKSKSINHSTAELLVLVTPEVIDPMSEEHMDDPKLAIPLLDPKGFDATLPVVKTAK
ncbi:type II and III secretion system protein [Granulicella sp. WH15]|uniref:type II and III secretion system protein family protein n=1 Tax=Granulicella sp. WH15 TaxID=2602070 RepID=UPI001366E2AA|nr:pilus assembly protein N-terminal domain-containing protein [Granulicella sp. WH15]QHN02690.1 type II and III secretion system protein [Granulicella sp. WH15]